MGNFWQRLFRSPPPAAKRTRPVVPRPARVVEDDVPTEPDIPLTEVADRFYRFVLDAPPGDRQEASPFEQATLKRLELLSTRFDVRSLPRLPSVLPQLLRTLKNDNAGGGQLAKLVGRDPAMVGEVMRVTSSVYYRSAQPITSLQQAVVLLGQEGLRRVLTQYVMKPILQASAGAPGQAAGERLWEHAERCAHACAWLGRQNGGDNFEAYLAGTVCHTGAGAVVRLLDQMEPASPPQPPSSAFLAACGALAARLSLQAARHWELPLRVTEALDEHQAGNPPVTPLGKVLVVADYLAMAQLLGEHERLPPEASLAHSWPGLFAPALVARCQQDLRRHFPGEKAPA